ncbi:hypothetical protein ES703_35261 [subsurface metagenome]
MNIPKAIEIKYKYQYILQDASLPELIEADNLSIEALKRFQEGRPKCLISTVLLLPGETEGVDDG